MRNNIVLSQEEIQFICAKLAKQIEAKIKNADKVPVFVGVLKGSMNFMMDLLKHIKTPIYTDYIQVRSYFGTSSTGRVQLLKDLSYDCEGRDVFIIEDIVDTGLSMQFLLEHIKSHQPRNIYVCSLFDKVNARMVEVNVDFAGKVLEKNDFLIGYGLDYNELERNVPFVYSATPEDIKILDEILEKDENDSRE